MAMIFQNARAALNPVVSVGAQLEQVLRTHRGLKGPAAHQAAVEVLRRVHIGDPERRMRSYPHELSGGMAQRATLAIALSCGSRLLIADEPTTGLDVTVQHEITELLRELRDDTGLAVLLITHDLALAAELCDRIAVLYCGRLAEIGPVPALVGHARHPYTAALFAARPRLGAQDLPTLPGQAADVADPPPGCRFHPRCSNRIAVCPTRQPVLEQMPPGQWAACHNPVPIDGVARPARASWQAPS
jgi:oligopeptide/dipeptide ABC transporter ATP-binding protein